MQIDKEGPVKKMVSDGTKEVELQSTMPEVEIRLFRGGGADGRAFRALNEEWITRFFTLESSDRAVLGDPEAMILQKGGQIFMVDVDGEAVGCAALIPLGSGVYELSKMAVLPKLRGLGIGRRLLLHAVAQAKAIGATRLFLGSSTKLENAVHLYESVGFRHVPPASLPPMPYMRADVFMEMPL